MLQNNQVTHYETNLLKVGDNSQFHVETVHHDIFLEDHVSAAKFEIERKSSINACISMMKIWKFENFRYVNGQFQGETWKKTRRVTDNNLTCTHTFCAFTPLSLLSSFYLFLALVTNDSIRHAYCVLRRRRISSTHCPSHGTVDKEK